MDTDLTLVINKKNLHVRYVVIVGMFWLKFNSEYVTKSCFLLELDSNFPCFMTGMANTENDCFSYTGRYFRIFNYSFS